jgi:hypothetical protein
MAVKFTRWIIFTIFFSLVPVLASYILAIAKAGELIPLTSVLEHGELYLLSFTFSAVGLGEIVVGNVKWQIPKLITSGVSVFNLGLSTLLFAYANGETGVTSENLARFSYPIFILSCIVATTCIFLSEIKDD